ncbi:MAG TPA: hypothetical protein PLL55_02535 [Candidatus Aminicenantes bacterium]|nr:hypothetical protein [Candidatus Aminicenantes bacterium]HPH42820.1 hypothetical protein [Candidatus Aminicenantes bacterium]
MKFRKAVIAVVLLGMAASASAQDLAAAARKEKERRASLKGKPSVTVTNTDLTKATKKAAISETRTEDGEQTAAAEGAPAEPEMKPSAVAAEPSQALVVETAVDVEGLRADLQDKYDRAKERLEYVTLKMRALQQQFFSFNTMESKAKLQQDIAQTNLDIQAAAAEEARLKKELEDFDSKNPGK